MELLEEKKKDSSIQTEYTKKLLELLPLVNFWFIPSVFPGTKKELHHKFHFVAEVLSHMRLPLYDDDAMCFTEKFSQILLKSPMYTLLHQEPGVIIRKREEMDYDKKIIHKRIIFLS